MTALTSWAMTGALLTQFAQMALVLGLAPLLTGLVRKVKARLQRRQGPPLLQPYRDLRRLFGKDVVMAANASWLFRGAPYVVFAITWVAASLIPTFATGLLFSWSGDLLVIIALFGGDGRGVLLGGGHVVDRAGTNDHQQPRVVAAQDRLDPLAGPLHRGDGALA